MAAVVQQLAGAESDNGTDWPRLESARANVPVSLKEVRHESRSARERESRN